MSTWADIAKKKVWRTGGSFQTQEHKAGADAKTQEQGAGEGAQTQEQEAVGAVYLREMVERQSKKESDELIKNAIVSLVRALRLNKKIPSEERDRYDLIVLLLEEFFRYFHTSDIQNNEDPDRREKNAAARELITEALKSIRDAAPHFELDKANEEIEVLRRVLSNRKDPKVKLELDLELELNQVKKELNQAKKEINEAKNEQSRLKLEECEAALASEKARLADKTQQCEDASAMFQTIRKLRPIEARVVCIISEAGEMSFMLTEKIAREAISFQAFDAWNFDYYLPEYKNFYLREPRNAKAYVSNDFIGKYYVFQIEGHPQKMMIQEIDYWSCFRIECWDPETEQKVFIPLSEARFKELKE